MASIQTQIARLQAQVAELASKSEAVHGNLDDDDGVSDRIYTALGDVLSNNPTTVKNTTAGLKGAKGSMLKFEDAQGKEWLVAPYETVTAIGLTKGIQSLLDRGYLTAA